MISLLKKKYNRLIQLACFLHDIAFFKTIWFNFRYLPFSQARYFPVLIYPRVQSIGLYRGCVKLNGKLRFAMVRIGFAKWPIAPTKKTYTLLRFERNGKLTLNGECTIKCGCSICVYKNASLEIGKDFLTNMHSKILCKQKIYIGEHCRLGWNVQIYDSNFHFIYNEEQKNILPCHGEVFIHDNVWITNQCTVSKGAVIPAFSMVASGSLICKDFSKVISKGNVFAGRPAKLLSTGSFRIMNMKNEHFFLDYFEKNPNALFYNIDSFDASMLEN